VHRLIWKNASCCAGVEAEVAGSVRPFFAERVIICAGALNTPAILMRSGIGDPTGLRSLDIDVKVPLPGVGAELSDHPTVIIWSVPKAGSSVLGEPVHQAFLRCTSTFAIHRNDLNISMLSSVSTDLFPMLKQALGSPIAIGVAVGLMRPRSRGRVCLASADPYSPPHVTVNCLGDKEDINPLKEGIGMAWRLMQHAQICSHVERTYMWTSGMIGSNAALERAISSAVRPSWHPVGSVKMGVSPNSGAVVDVTGRVFGVENLWVADASIMPTIPSAPTNLTCIMIGEKMALELQKLS
jgi:choline dehydrogenase